ncbi:unnamed protein product [Effrenium voratum]|uniref:Pentatricopeptide repeat-containing protein n=1 Tax=Effrenium voratum TaxID=2562239 RepID=A0AA36N2U3_9DINO|nr:unnamed protein product [Effrenium voratum]
MARRFVSGNELNDWERSIALLQAWLRGAALREEQLLPALALRNADDLISFNAALHTCTGAARWEEALGLVQELRMEALRPDIYSVTGACSVCSHAGQWQRALALAEEARKGRLHPDALLFSTLLFACEKGSQWELAVEIMADMRRSEVALDALGCGIAIRACAAKGSWDLALWVLAGCEKPGPQAFLAAVDAVEASGAPATPELFEELCRKAASSAVF